ncbi:hypothetical protein [uncultured Desulfovibrio sp.]|uniref:hypothetical protein n=1 Tax=uncultured Desulfovibrio sp. TaxID=167968 RepID=UPI00039CC53B|nr:hypothetical protein [uncultured Desulfovibrio sp.]
MTDDPRNFEDERLSYWIGLWPPSAALAWRSGGRKSRPCLPGAGLRPWVAGPGRSVYEAFLHVLHGGLAGAGPLYAPSVPVTVQVWEIRRGTH